MELSVPFRIQHKKITLFNSDDWVVPGLFFSGKRGAGTHKRGKGKHTESFVEISLYNITVYFITS
jgi:hypothetical protein